MITTRPFLSIIIPLYNEQGRLKKISQIYKFLDRQDFNYEVIPVNDGSEDDTLKKLKLLSKKFKFHLVTYAKNRGKGFAVKSGMLAAKGRFRLFIDIDLSTPIAEISKFLPHLAKHHLLIGSRKMTGSDLLIRQSPLREALGKSFTVLSRLVLNLNVSDFTCGFKCFSKKAAEDIFSRQKIERWGFDSEILFLAKKLGYEIKEVPVQWSNDPKTRVKFPLDVITSLMDLCIIRYNNLKKKYEK